MFLVIWTLDYDKVRREYIIRLCNSDSSLDMFNQLSDFVSYCKIRNEYVVKVRLKENV